MSKPWNPLQDLMHLQDRMNRLFEDATERRARAADSDEIETADWHPAADVYDTEAAYLIAVDLPGVERSALDIDLDDEKLVIRGTRTINQSGEKAMMTRPRGRFRRSFTVPANVAHEGIQAEYKNGVLQLTLPKRNEPRAQRIQIKVQ
ncbi:MAG: Hsp20/alpha crystallin family protein [Acidobacteriota bacterium]|nr:Hsp20/alpha crystallin family protein [Acidobacteriota bacterium]